jgi:hypothetical protein
VPARMTYFNRCTLEAFMRVVVLPLVAVVSCVALAVPAQTAPVVPHQGSLSISAITLVRQRCGQGMKRAMASQDKQGAWHGPCVPKHGARSSGAVANQGDIANQLNAQEAARTAGAGMGGTPAPAR